MSRRESGRQRERSMQLSQSPTPVTKCKLQFRQPCMGRTEFRREFDRFPRGRQSGWQVGFRLGCVAFRQKNAGGAGCLNDWHFLPAHECDQSAQGDSSGQIPGRGQ